MTPEPSPPPPSSSPTPPTASTPSPSPAAVSVEPPTSVSPLAAPPAPPPPTTVFEHSVTITLVAAGDVSDFDEPAITAIERAVAQDAGVPASNVNVVVTSASVSMAITVATTNATQANTLMLSYQNKMTTSEAANSFFASIGIANVNVTSTPTLAQTVAVRTASPPPAQGSPPPSTTPPSTTPLQPSLPNLGSAGTEFVSAQTGESDTAANTALVVIIVVIIAVIVIVSLGFWHTMNKKKAKKAAEMFSKMPSEQSELQAAMPPGVMSTFDVEVEISPQGGVDPERVGDEIEGKVSPTSPATKARCAALRT